MRQAIIILIVSLFAVQATFGQKSKNSKRFVSDKISGIYIPKDIEDCFSEIDTFWSDSIKNEVRFLNENDFMANAHFGFGMWMRNNWQLWSGSRLSKYFNELGIYHPDDMSGIILKSYHRYLTGKEINLQQQIDYCNAYWKVLDEPSKKNYPEGEKKIKFDTKMLYNIEEGVPACIHIQSNSKTEKTWIYDYYRGWKQLSKNELGKLKATTQDNREKTVRELFENE